MANSLLYMSFTGVDGSDKAPGDISNAPAGGKWIALTGCSLAAEGKGSHKSGTTVLDMAPITVTKTLDSASVPLLDAFLRNTSTSSVVITHVRVEDGSTGPAEYLRYELTNAQILEFAQEGGDDTPTERITMFFGAIEITSWDYDQADQATPASTMIMNEV